MREFQEKRQWKKTFKSRYFIIFLIILIGLIAHGIWNAYARYVRSEAVVTNLEAEKGRLLDRQNDLERNIEALQTREGIDREIRATYGLVQPGEELIIVVGGQEGSTSGDTTFEKSWWDKFLDLFR